MIKKITLISLALLSLVLMSGCAKTHVDVSSDAHMVEFGNGKLIVVGTYNDEDAAYGFVHMKKNNNAKFLLQGDAEVTLSSGYSYFRVIKPFDSSSEMITEPEELKKRCYELGLETSFIGQNGCFYKHDQEFRNVIVMYKEKPKNLLVIEATSLIEQLKADDLYVGDGDIPIVKTRKLTSYRK